MTKTAWEVLDIDCDDETRQAPPGSSSLTSLYEVVKLAYLQPTCKDDCANQVEKLPSGVCSAAWGFVCLALDSSLLLFAENCSTLQLQLNFNDTIDTLLWLGSGNFLAVGDRSGKLHFIHVPSNRLIITRQLPVCGREEDGPLFVGSSCQPIVDGVTAVLLVTADAALIRVGNLNLEQLQEGLSRGCVEELLEVEAQLTLDYTASLVQDAQVTCSGSFMGVRDSDVWLWFGCSNGQLLQYCPQSSFVPLQQQQFINTSPDSKDDSYTSMEELQPTVELLTMLSNAQASYKKIIPVCNARYLVTLSSSGSLGLTCVLSGLSNDYQPQSSSSNGSFVPPVLDVISLPWTEASHAGSDDLQLLVLVDNQRNKRRTCMLRILSVPGLVCEYEVEVSEGSQLMPLGEGMEAMVFLEPEMPPDYQRPVIKIKTIVDGIPEARLKKLISKLKFREAEEFGRHFKLDVELVYKGRARHLVHLLNPYTISTTLHATNTTASNIQDTGASLLSELVEVLNSVHDMEFVTTLCVKAMMPDIPATATLLNYAKSRLSHNTKMGSVSSLGEEVGRELYKLNTFCMLHSVDDTSIEQWQTFAAADLLILFMDHLHKGDLSLASSIWQRHQHEFQESVDQDCVRKILNLLSISLPSSVLIAWLPHNLSDIIRICPSAIDTIACWALTRIKRLEVFEKNNWPGNALGLGNCVMSILETVVEEFSAGGNMEVQMELHLAQWKAHMSPSSWLYKLRETLLALQELETLAQTYRIKITLAHYTQEDKGEVVSCLLDWLVCGEEVAPLVEGFIIPVLLKQGQASADDLLAQYVHETLASNSMDWWSWQEAQWEDKLYAVIAVMKDEQARITCIVSCVRRASVPWSSGTSALCVEGLELLDAGGGGTADRFILAEQMRLMKLKMVLRKHAIHISTFSDARSGEVMLRRLARSNQSDVMDDMLQVVSTYIHLTPSQAYMYRIYHLICTGEYDEGRAVLDSISNQEDLSDTCTRVLHCVIQTLHFAPCNQKMRVSQSAMVSGVVSLQQLLRQHGYDKQRVDRDLETIHTISNLQRKFDIYPKWGQLHDSKQCEVLLQQHIESWYKKNSSKLIPGNKVDDNSKAVTEAQTSAADAGEKQLPIEKKKQEHEDSSSATEGDEGCSAQEPCASASMCNVAEVLELCRLLGRPPTVALQQLAALALQHDHLSVAIDMARRLSEELVSSSRKHAGELTALVHGMLQLLLKRLQQQNRARSENEICEESFGECVVEQQSDETGESQSKTADISLLLQLVLDMVAAASLHAHPSSLQWLTEVGVWCNTGVALYQHCHQEGVFSSNDDHDNDGKTNRNASDSLADDAMDPYAIWRFSPLYRDTGMPIDHKKVSLMVSSALETCIMSYDPCSSSNNAGYQRTEDSVRNLTQAQLQPLLSALTDLAMHAMYMNNDLSALIIRIRMADLRAYCSESAQDDVAFSPLVTPHHISALLLKIINPKKTDVKLAVSLLTFLSLKQSLFVLNELIKRFGFDYPRLEAVADIGINLCGINNKVEIKIRFESVGKNARWGRRLGELNISFKEYFGKHAAALQKLFNVIVINAKCTHALLKDFCSDFELSLTDALLCYLKCLMSSFVPEPIKVSEEPEVWYVPEISQSLTLQMHSIVTKIEDRVLLRGMLSNELDNTMCYNYDVIQFMLQYLDALDKNSETDNLWQRGLDIIKFLKGYQRRAKPNVAELDEWLRNDPSSLSLPNLSWQRLPFHDMFQGGSKLIMSIITNELDVNTIDIWLRCADSLKLNKDQMCFVAIQNTLSRTLDKRIKREGIKWQLAHNHSGLLKEIDNVILKIKHDKLAMACGKNVVKLLPPGIDKVDSAENCYQMSLRWHKNSDSLESSDAVTKFLAQHQQLAVEHALHKYGVADPEYIKLLQDPVALITALYRHPSLTSLTAIANDKMPKINECVTEICQKAQCNQAEVQLELLDLWLPPTEGISGSPGGSAGDMNQTISDFQLNILSPGSSNDASSPNAEQESLSRVIYLLRGCDPSHVVPYLLECAENSSSSVGSGHRLRALKCLLAVADPHTLSKYVAMPQQKIKSLLQSLSYVCRLESIGCPTDPEQLASVDKSALAEGVWRSNRHNPHALLLIADICIDYQVNKPSLWNAVLNQLANLVGTGGVEEARVETLLLQLRQHPQLWLLRGLATAWYTLINRPFETGRRPLSAASLSRCIHRVGLLAKCPVALSGLELLVKSSVALQQPALAIVIAAAACPPNQPKLEAMFNETSREDLIKQFKYIKAQIPLPRLVENLLQSNDLVLE
uniref:Kinetochore-associated protein 1-like n=1 Tax=Hirondellea gigas TaxID=1518452 RepID=A0A6A7FZQ8_9CRUS